MKFNKLVVVCLIVGLSQQLLSQATMIAVPKKCLIEKASLVFVMLDQSGKECVGTCQLSEQFEGRKILQDDLSIKSEIAFDNLQDSVDVTCSSKQCDSEVLLHLEFDRELRVVKVLLVKDNLLADNPFDVLSINVATCDNEFDDLSALLASVDVEEVAASITEPELSRLETCKLYLQVALAVQYSYARRKLSNAFSWLTSK